LTFDCGAGQMIPGFDAAVRDMAEGETKTVRLEPEEAYGMPDPRQIQTVPFKLLRGSEALEVGQQIMLSSPYGQSMPAKVVAKDDTSITLDMNHELAGQALTFEITLIEVWDAPEE